MAGGVRTPPPWGTFWSKVFERFGLGLDLGRDGSGLWFGFHVNGKAPACDRGLSEYLLFSIAGWMELLCNVIALIGAGFVDLGLDRILCGNL